VDTAGEVCPACFTIHPAAPGEKEKDLIYDEAAGLPGGLSGDGKTAALDKLTEEILQRRNARLAGPGLGQILREKWNREEISGYLPGKRPEYTERVHDGVFTFGPERRGKSCMDIKLRLSIDTPVRVGDVVPVIDSKQHERPFPGHVVDINGGWITVASRLGRKRLFFAQSGWDASDYRWRLEPYIPQETR
jgi:hypothetical protein